MTDTNVRSGADAATRRVLGEWSIGTDGRRPWWMDAVIYQVYPRSFADGNGDGIGDLDGLISRLDHLSWLGVDAVWLSPVFTSPMADFGYDVADYCDIDPVFGSLDDLDRLLVQAHSRGIKVLLDWVPNHTSDQHPWFQESRRDRTNPKADWYVWRDEPCNNWLAAFPRGAKAWTFDPQRGQYYLHCFLSQQPDLNWDNPDVEAAMHDTLRFWLDRGVDGFRMDVIHLIGKDLEVDDPESFSDRSWSHCPANDVAITHERIRRIRQLLDSYPGERVCVGEVFILDETRMSTYYGDGDELHLSFNFPFLWAEFQPTTLRERIERTVGLLADRGAWPTWVLSNHDAPRHLTRYDAADDEVRRDAVARQAAALVLTLPGSPFLYQGEELGLGDAHVPPEAQVDPGLRDGCRAPIPWNPEPLHGWNAMPWLPFAAAADRRNVETQRADSTSVLHWYRQMLALRRDHADLRRGDFELLDSGDHVLAYRRGPWLVAINLGDSPASIPAVEVALGGAGETGPCASVAPHGVVIGRLAV